MASHLATRLGALRHLSVSNALSRPTRVIEVQSQLRQLSLASTPRFTAPLAGQISGLNSQQTHAFATTSESGKPKRAAKPKSKSTTKRKSSTTTKKPKKELTEEQKEKKAKRAELDHRRELREKALQEPKKLPQTARGLAMKDAFAEHRGQHEGAVAVFKAASASLNEQGNDRIMERYQAQVDKNRAANDAAYEEWVKSYTPLQIKEANNARRALGRLTGKRVNVIKDDRQVKRPSSAFIQFVKDRPSHIETRNRPVSEIQVETANAWKQLSDSEKAPYIQRAAEDRERYRREHLEVYGVEPQNMKAEE
ncbi:uncharacterized protein N7469_001498 [Penicillium citrinum]|uniref:HMG box domain-containing protein n=2 Tax=Penicillium TaxID=5073 RepID=A0A9W9PEV3_PENCI|nr:uncharacterized protein N7469_001498 [Penicillium citrinum]KAJ5243171.1 hypothetical protein N7469_001498 [Penicillium citrinum]KAJ5599326.1 hypothetical protein N7450_000393 [Penicillium hetheringtonii]